MQRIYRVEVGEYEDWTILAEFVEKPDAERFAERYNTKYKDSWGDRAEVDEVELYGPGEDGPDLS